MKVLSIGSDRKLFEENSPVSGRVAEYGKEFESFHVVVFSLASKNLKEKKISDNVTIYPTNSASRLSYIRDAIKIGKKIILEQKFIRGNSVVTTQDPFESGFTGWRIAKEFRLPIQMQIHTDFLSPQFNKSILQKIRVLLAKFLLPRADYVRVVSKRISESIEKAKIHLKNPPQILPVFVDISALESTKSDIDLDKMFPQFKFTILMASRLTEEKRIPDALSAFSKVVKFYPHTGLIIAGDGPLKKELENKAKSLGIENNVVFLGWRDDVYSLMKSANMFLSVSAYEGYGMSIIEAGLARCPVLSTNVGVAGDILTHKKNSYVCPVSDIMCLYEGIMALIGNNSLRYGMAQMLASDIESSLPTKEEYIKAYVKLLKDSVQNS